MKASELSSLIRKIVAEEVKKQLPSILSEMYVKKIVLENTRSATGISLSENLNLDIEDEHSVSRQSKIKTLSHEQLKEKIRLSVLENPQENPLAELYEGVSIPDEAAGSDGIPLDAIPGFSGNFSKFVEPVATNSSIKETASMVERRIEQQRKKLDLQKIK